MRRFAVLVFVGLLFLLFSCASTESVETLAPEVPLVTEAPSTEVAPDVDTSPVSIATLVVPKRAAKFIQVPRYGDHLIIGNDTGFTLTRIDVFNAAMYGESTDMENLLGGTLLGDQQEYRVDLSDFPPLATALQSKQDEMFIVNAIDHEGDLYHFAWNPLVDPWNIVVPFSAYDQGVEEPDVGSQGDVILISNRSGVVLEDLRLEDPFTSPSETDLLADGGMLPGTTVQVAVADVPWIADQLPFDTYGRVVVSAVDELGDSYSKYWYPSSDSWHIEVFAEDLAPVVPIPSGDQVLTITNTTGTDFWFIHLATEDMYAEDDYGDDLLGNEILYSGESIHIDLSLYPHIWDALNSMDGSIFHLVGFDVEDLPYHLLWKAQERPWDVVLTEQNFSSPPLPDPSYGMKELSLENNTGEDLWFLYLVTEAMHMEGDEGRDVLGDSIWLSGESISIIPESFIWIRLLLAEEPDATIQLLAYAEDDSIYRLRWSPASEQWSLAFTEDELIAW
jgi:hypothetical protein